MVPRCSVVAVLPLIAVLVGDARAGAFTHEASVKPEVKLSERAKPPPRRDSAPAPPSADTLLAVEDKLVDVHVEQAELLRGLIARTPDENVEEKADYYLRLGEIHGKTQRLHRLKGAEDEIALGKETDPKRRAQLAASAAAHKTAETAALIAAIETYRVLIENPRFASYPRLDAAVFAYAYTLHHAERPREARAAYDQLLKDHPRSRFVIDAHLALGDYAFEAGQLDEAAVRYQKVLKFPASPLLRYAQYKLGWVELGQRKYPACREAAADMSGQLARAYHQEAVKTQNLAYFGYADRLYRAYLGAFRDAADFADTRYFHAELGWAGAELSQTPGLAAQRWQDVANAFTEVVETGKLSAQRIQVSADAAMQAWMKALAVDPAAHPEPPRAEAVDGKPPAPQLLPAPQQKLLAAYDVYLTHVADGADDERIAVTFLKADLLRRFDHLAEAIPLFEGIVAHHPDHETAEYAAQLVLDSENRLSREAAMLGFASGLPPAFLAAHPRVRDTVARLGHQARRKEAERLEARGHATGHLEDFVACGERYLEIYNLSVDAPDANEVLYNAGVCFEFGKSLGGAIRVFETVHQQAPKSPLAERALARLGNLYATTAQYREAAERLEAYAANHAGAADAGRALSDAVQFRKGLGDDKLAIADTEKFVAMFGAKQPAEAAGAYFSLAAIYEQQGDLDRLAHHLRAYLDRYGTIGGAERRVIAWSKLGDALWRQACPVATVDGACVKAVRRNPPGRQPSPAAPAAIPKRCGDDSRIELATVPRDDREVRAATTAFETAIAEYERAGTLTGDPRGALYYYALARFNRAERDYEQYLATPLPASLDFDRKKPELAARSHQRFDEWIAGKTALGVRLRGQYQPLTTLGDAAIAIAAAARIAAVSQHLSAQLYRAEIPANLRTGAYAEDSSLAYCETLEQVAEPLETEALTYYQACLNTSTKLGWFSEWSRICERELGQLRPDRFPSTLELRREPSAAATITQLEAPAR